MADETKRIAGAQFCFRDSTDFGPATASDYRTGTPTYAQFDLTDLANGSGRQSAKIDLGAQWALEFGVYLVAELIATPTTGERIDLYWAPSPHSSATRANPHGMSGSDAALAGNYGTAAELLKNLMYIGSLVVTDDVTIQHGFVGVFTSPTRYGMMVVQNEADAAFAADAVESYVLIEELHPQYQTS